MRKKRKKAPQPFRVLRGGDKRFRAPAGEVPINEDFCFPARKAGSGRSEVYQDMHELRTGRA
jgi:hypothetical protein